MKIVIMEPLGISHDAFKALAMLLRADGHEIVAYPNRAATTAALIERVCDADVIILANQPLHREVLSRCSMLKMVDVAFTGVDHVDVEYLRERKIPICNAAGYSTAAVAELTMGLAIDLFRTISLSDRTLRQGSGTFAMGRELSGKTFGIIGTGAIGLHVARLAKAFGCHLIGFSRTEKEEAKALGVCYVDLDTLMRKADLISLHVPMTKATTHLIGERQIRLMKPDAVLINTARGPLVDYQALADALKSQRIAGAGIDVFETEPPLPADHPLLKAPNCILTPHMAYATKEALYQRAAIVFDNVRYWLEGNPQNLI